MKTKVGKTVAACAAVWSLLMLSCQQSDDESSRILEKQSVVVDETIVDEEPSELAAESENEVTEPATEVPGQAGDEQSADAEAEPSEKAAEQSESETELAAEVGKQAGDEQSADVDEQAADVDEQAADADEQLAGVDEQAVAASVGDVILRDGTRIPYASLASRDIAAGDVVAVVAYLTDTGYVACGLPVADACSWAEKDAVGGSKIIAEIACQPSLSGTGSADEDCDFSGDCDGSDNWLSIAALDEEEALSPETYYPAFAAVLSYASAASLGNSIAGGWYIPSLAELYLLYKNLAIINGSLAQLGISAVSGSFWSSTCPVAGENTDYIKSAWYVNTKTATLYSATKTSKKSVIPIRVFVE